MRLYEDEPTKGPRDTQRQRLYDAERGALSDYPASDLWKATVGDRRGLQARHPDIQRYVDAVLRERWFQSRWGQRRIEVLLKRGNALGYTGGPILIPGWARQERVVLHELAHALTVAEPAHGPEFAGMYLTLVRFAMGAEAGRKLREAYRGFRVRMSLAAVPDPDPRQVVTKADEAAAKQRRKVAPLHRNMLANAAETVRRLVAQGHYGEAGRKPRDHALETVRRLEELVRVGPGVITQEYADQRRLAAASRQGRQR